MDIRSLMDIRSTGRRRSLRVRLSIARAPMLVPLQNPLIRYFSGLIFYLLLPLTMLLFAWKAAVFTAWGLGLLCVAAAVVASHLMLPLKKFSWPLKAFLSTCAAIVVFANVGGYGLAHRPFNLFRANLSGQWFIDEDFRGANLRFGNLSGAHLNATKLNGADLSFADLNGADLIATKLNGANLSYAKLNGTKNLIQKQLDKACGNEDTTLPGELYIAMC